MDSRPRGRTSRGHRPREQLAPAPHLRIGRVIIQRIITIILEDKVPLRCLQSPPLNGSGNLKQASNPRRRELTAPSPGLLLLRSRLSLSPGALEAPGSVRGLRLECLSLSGQLLVQALLPQDNLPPNVLLLPGHREAIFPLWASANSQSRRHTREELFLNRTFVSPGPNKCLANNY